MAEARPSTPPVLATYGLTRNFGGLVAVRDVSIVLRQGELHAVIGPNGAGKTTLVNMLSGEIRPTAGRIELMGRDVAGAPSWRMTGLGVGRSFQRTNIFASLTVLENVRLAVQAVSASARHLLREVSRETVLIERAEQALQHVGLADAAPRVAGVLSHGEQRQLEIAMALAGEPRMLLLDEPMAGMGAEESHDMVELLRRLKTRCGMLLIEHDMDAVFALADRITVLVYGRAIASGTSEEIRANAEVRQAYLGEDTA
jgi:branched-chain amino acid transport system ATP-binding protein